MIVQHPYLNQRLDLPDRLSAQRAGRDRATASLQSLIMPYRPHWNRMGPPLPAWFRRRIRRIDPQLVMQFLPPSTQVARGSNPMVYPDGVWAICRRMRRTRFLFKTWVYALRDADGKYAPPDMKLVRMIRVAHNMWRSGGGNDLMEFFDHTIDAALRERERVSRDEMMGVIIEKVRQMGRPTMPNSPVFFAGPN